MKPPFDVEVVRAHELEGPHDWAMVEDREGFLLIVREGAVDHRLLEEAWEGFRTLRRSAARRLEVLYDGTTPVAHLVPFVADDDDSVGGIAVCGCEPWLGLGSPAEWSRAHELPLCITCKKWTTRPPLVVTEGGSEQAYLQAMLTG